jgi:hypothetical protein
MWAASANARGKPIGIKKIRSGCRLIEFPRVSGLRGDLTFIEGGRHIPFDIKRVYYLYNVPEDMTRARHAHKRLHQILVAISGSFDVKLDDGVSTAHFHLDSPHLGLYIPPMTWRVLEEFSAGAVCVVFASEFYSESDYYRDYDDFLKALKRSDQ